MKKIVRLILMFIFIVGGLTTLAQNLVPNPSFEQYSICPSTSFEIDKVISWSSAGGSPDYFNSCAGAGGASVPDNFYGYQNTIIGDAYVGLYTYNRGLSWPDHREHIQADLLSPLTIGVQYYVSMDISFTLDNNEIGFAADKLGMLFTNSTSYDAGNPPFTINNAQVFIDTIISDTINWYHFESSFIADSAYQKILIGNFFDDANTNIQGIDTSLYIAYYYVDNICVSLDSVDCLLATPIMDYEIEDEIKIYPIPSNQGYIFIELGALIETYNFEIINNIGDIVKLGQVNSNENRGYISLSLPQGIYFLRIYNHSKNIIKKIIIN